jgi:hypothetical protein
MLYHNEIGHELRRKATNQCPYGSYLAIPDAVYDPNAIECP